MGSVKCDLYKTAVDYDHIYAYQEAGVTRLLQDVYRTREEESLDTNAIVLRIDLESALSSKAITPRERQCIALYYFGCLTLEESAKLLGSSLQSVHTRIYRAIPRIAEHMDGGEAVASQMFRMGITRSDGTALGEWLEAVAYNESRWYDVPDAVWKQLNEIFPVSNDKYVPKAVDYKWRSERSLHEERHRREILKPEIYPTDGNFGAISEPDGTKRRLNRYCS